MLTKKVSIETVKKVIGGSDLQASKLISALQDTAANSTRAQTRIQNASQSKLVCLIMLEQAFLDAQAAPNAKFRFRQVDIFNAGTWHLHLTSKPDIILQVDILENGKWVKTAINVGFSYQATPSNRMGFGDYLNSENAFWTKKGELPKVALVSGYVENHKSTKVAKLRSKNIRAQIEYALINILFKAGYGIVLSSLLFNLRKNPIKGVFEGTRDLYSKFFVTAFPFEYQFNATYRKLVDLNRENFNISTHGKGKNSAAVYLAYFNIEIMDMSNVPKIDWNLVKEECDILASKNPTAPAIKTFYSRVLALVKYSYGLTKTLKLPTYPTSEFLTTKTGKIRTCIANPNMLKSGDIIKINWADGDDDEHWKWFRWIKQGEKKIKLQGIDDLDYKQIGIESNHRGDMFWVYKTEILEIEVPL